MELQASLSRIEQMKRTLHYLQDQVAKRDHIMREVVVQIQGVAEHLQTLAIQADILSVKYESESDQGQKLASLLREMQDRFQLQVQERLDKMQQDMSEKMRESQDDMMTKLTQLITGGSDKGKGPMANVEEGNSDEPLYPSGFTPPHVRTQPCKSTVTIMPQQFRAGVSNFQAGLGSNPENNPVNSAIPDFDEVAEKERIKEELPKQLEERCKWLEEKFRAMEVTESYRGIDAKELSLVPNLILPHKFKMPEFEKYNGTSCPEAHITMFCRRMTGYVNNDQLLIHCFQDSLTGTASKWYNQLSRATIGS
ncbi:hypothetical protein Gotur_029991 [Gossypium turneri]